MTEKIILTDEPLKSPYQDKLAFAPFAKKIATIIKNMQVKENIVFAVYGKWGSGKTTFLNFLAHHLKEDDSIIIVKFNPWWFSGKEDLIRQFLYNLKITLGKSTNLKNIAKTLEPYIEALGEIPQLGGFFRVGWRFIKASQKNIEEAKEEIIKQLEF